MTHKEWLEKRRKGIGGSDAGAVCGVNPWRSPYQVWLEKRGEAPGVEDNPAMYWGRTLEPVIRQHYANVTGHEVKVPKTILKHPKRKFMLANLDGIANNDRVLEIKTSRSPQKWGEPGTNEIPDVYLLQVQHYLSVVKLDLADVAVLIGGNDFRIYEVPADSELQEILMEREADFWRMVENGDPPDPTTFADIRQRYKFSKDVQVTATPELTAVVEKLKEFKELKTQEENLKAEIMAYMKDADTLIHPIDEKILATWKTGKPSKRLDTRALKAEQPDIYEQYAKVGEPTRPLLIK